MSRRSWFLVLCSAPALAAGLAAQDRLTGAWAGHWIRAGDSLPVTLRVTRDAATGAYGASFDSDRLRVTGIPFTAVTVEGCCAVTMRLVGDRTTALFTGTIRGDTLAGDLQEEDGAGRFVYTRARAAPAPPVEREITFRNGDVTLAGSLLLPATPGPHPAVVFVHGSGGEGRWANRFLADALVARGIAALIWDKRGVGKSSGDWRTATVDDLAADAAAAVARLREEDAVDARRIGIHGHSQGGTFAPLFAVRAAPVAFVIASAASGIPTDSTEIFSVLNFVLPQATTAADSAAARDYVSELVGVAYRGQPRVRMDSLARRLQDRPWYFAPPAPDASYWTLSRSFGAYQPLQWWARVRVPVLLISGTDDAHLPAPESAARIAATLLRTAPDADVTVRLLAGADHTFRLPRGPSGWPRTAPDYLPALLGWLVSRTSP